jgi:hypothetical protein
MRAEYARARAGKQPFVPPRTHARDDDDVDLFEWHTCTAQIKYLQALVLARSHACNKVGAATAFLVRFSPLTRWQQLVGGVISSGGACICIS